MSDLFMNKQRRRHQRWNPQQHLATADAASSSASTSFAATPIKKTSRSTRAGTPGALKANNNYFSYHIDNNDSSDEMEYVEKSSQNTNNHNDYDPLANILSLQLRKPNHWKWELTTSKSCSNIALPRILLYDHKGNLLVDAPPDAGGDANSEQIYKQEDYEPTPAKPKKRPYSSHRSATTNLTHSVRKALEKEFDGLHIEEVPPTPRKNSAFTTNTSTPTPTSTIRNRSRSHSRKPIDLHIGDLPDSSPRSSSLKGVRFNVDHDSKIPDFLPTPPSTTTPTTSSSSGPREKRKYRRSHSSGRLPSRTSSSILERLSYQKGRFSSPESEDGDEEDTAAGPRYSLRTDEAGTLIVHQDSSSSQNSRTRLRRKPQKYISSSDSLNRNETPSKLSLTPPVFDAAASPLSEASTTPSTKERRRKLLPIRRLLSDNNVILPNKDKLLSEDRDESLAVTVISKDDTKKEENNIEEIREENPKIVIEPEPAVVQSGGCNCVHHRRYKRNETKDLNASISTVGQQRNGKIR